jgi:hypothetical protein
LFGDDFRVHSSLSHSPDRVAAEVPGGILIVESCNSTWLVDPRGRRFRRVLKGLDLGVLEASTGWRDYHAVEIDEAADSLVVYLDGARTRLIRSPRHHRNCPHCRDYRMHELAPELLRELTRA